MLSLVQGSLLQGGEYSSNDTPRSGTSEKVQTLTLSRRGYRPAKYCRPERIGIQKAIHLLQASSRGGGILDGHVGTIQLFSYSRLKPQGASLPNMELSDPKVHEPCDELAGGRR